MLAKIVPNQGRDKVPFNQFQKAPAVEPVGKSPLGSRVCFANARATTGEKQGIRLVAPKIIQLEVHAVLCNQSSGSLGNGIGKPS